MSKVWRNGDIIDAAGAVAADDRGVLLGDGLFETLAVIDGAPLRLDSHLGRLMSSARLLDIPLTADRADLSGAIRALCASENIAEGTARITLLRGAGPRGVLPPAQPAPTLIVSVHAGVVGATAPVRAIVAQTTRKNERSPLAGIKSTNYLDAILARQEAARAGADDAILLNTADSVAEATAANIFCVIGGDLVTPPMADGALPGTMRKLIMTLETVIERSLAAEDLSRAAEIFLTNSTSVRAAVSLNGQAVGDGAPGPVASRLGELPRRPV
jgi:branched-chain amino acid aminotransferase